MERNIPTPEQRLSVVAASERIFAHLAAAEEDEAAEVTLSLVDIEEECNGGLMGEARMQLRRPLPPKLLALTCALLHVQAHPDLTPSPGHRPTPTRFRNSLRCALHPSCLRTRRHPNVWPSPPALALHASRWTRSCGCGRAQDRALAAAAASSAAATTLGRSGGRKDEATVVVAVERLASRMIGEAATVSCYTRISIPLLCSRLEPRMRCTGGRRRCRRRTDGRVSSWTDARVERWRR